MFTVDNIIEARYTNNKQDTIIVLWTDNNTGNFESYVEVNSVSHQELINAGWDHAKLIDSTADWKRTQAKAMHDSAINFLGNTYKDRVVQLEAEYAIQSKSLETEHDKLIASYAKKTEVLQEKYEKTQHLYGVGLIDNLFTNNTNADLVFQTKLEVLDKPEIKSASKPIKASIRQSKSLTELLGIICNIL